MKRTLHHSMAVLAVLLFFGISANSQNYSLSFDGSANEYVNLGNSTTLNTSHVTVEFWMKASTGTYPYSNVVDKSHDGTTYKSWGFEFDGGGSGQKLLFYYGNGSAMGSVSSTSNLDDNAWHHIAATYDGSKAILYIDGLKQDSNTTVTGNISSTTGNLYFASWQGTGRWFPGQIEEVRIWDVALTKAVINHNKDLEIGTGHPNYSGLVAYYQMSDGSGTSLTDDSPNSNDGVFSAGMDDANWIGASPLPLELLYFTSNCNQSGTELKWATATEVNVSHFELYASNDGMNYEKIATIDAEGNSNYLVEYSYFITKSDAQYYFLKEVDVDGSLFELSIIFADCDPQDEEDIQLYPNPVVNELNIEINQDQLNAEMQVFDVNGMMVHSQKLVDLNTRISLTDVIPAGVYFVQIRSNNKVQNKKLVVK